MESAQNDRLNDFQTLVTPPRNSVHSALVQTQSFGDYIDIVIQKNFKVRINLNVLYVVFVLFPLQKDP